jgi:DNA-binding HxlR family transcriptional regulator
LTVAGRRSYDDGCAAAHALDLVGERWALLVVRELLFGPKRFTDLRTGLPTVSPNVLSQRLLELEQAAVVQRRRLAPPAGSWVYELTDWGHELEPVIGLLGRWGARSPFLDRAAKLSVDSFALSLRNMFKPAAAAGVTATYELRFGLDRLRVEVRDGRIGIGRGSADRPDAVIETDPGVLAEIVYDGRDLDEAIRMGELTVFGDRSAVDRFVTLFALPEPAPAGGCDRTPRRVPAG